MKCTINVDELLAFENNGYTLVFDLDNTIYDEYIFLKHCFKKISNLYGDLSVYYFLSYTFERDGRKNLFNKLIRNFGNLGLDSPIDKFLSIYRNFDGVLTCFPWFDEYQSKTCVNKINIVTNGNVQQQQSKVRSIRFKIPINIVYANKTIPKPNPKSFFDLNIYSDKFKIIYIGDSYVDYEFAKNVGINFYHTNNILTFIK